MENGRGSSRLEESKYLSYFQEGQEERSEELKARQIYLSPWEGDSMNSPASHFQSYRDKNVTRNSKHGSVKAKSCLTNLVAFYNEIASLVEER